MPDELADSQRGQSLVDLLNSKPIENWSIQELISLISERIELKLTEIAEKIKVEYATLHKWVSKGSNPASNAEKAKVKRDLIRIVNEYNNTLQDNTIKYETNLPELRFDLDHPLVGIPLYENDKFQSYTDIPVATGTILRIDGKVCIIVCRNTIPSVTNGEGILDIFDEKLIRKFGGGLSIAITKQNFFKYIRAGHYHYIIDKNHNGIVRKITISAESNSLTIIAEGEEENITMSLDDVVAIFTVNCILVKSPVI